MSSLSTHVLDTTQGRPAAGLAIELSRLQGGRWELLGRAATNADGRAPGLLPADQGLEPGTYRLRFVVGEYWRAENRQSFYPEVDVVFLVEAGGGHYHVPLLTSPFG